MTYEEAKVFISTQHIYANVSALEAVNCPFNKSLTEVGGVVLLGTDVPYVAIAAKELIPVS